MNGFGQNSDFLLDPQATFNPNHSFENTLETEYQPLPTFPTTHQSSQPQGAFDTLKTAILGRNAQIGRRLESEKRER